MRLTQKITVRIDRMEKISKKTKIVGHTPEAHLVFHLSAKTNSAPLPVGRGQQKFDSGGQKKLCSSHLTTSTFKLVRNPKKIFSLLKYARKCQLFFVFTYFHPWNMRKNVDPPYSVSSASNDDALTSGTNIFPYCSGASCQIYQGYTCPNLRTKICARIHYIELF